MKLEDKITILVCSCDKYSDLWPPFFQLLKEYWPDNSCKIILNTESKGYSLPGLNIHSFALGKASYGKRMISHLSLIKTPYVLLLLDDFFLRRPVDTAMLINIIEKMDAEENIAAMTFDENPFYFKDCDEFMGFVKLKKHAPYKLNMQAGIWRTETLKKYWAPNDNPWIWEIFVNYNTFDNSDVFYALKDLELSPVYYGYNTNGMGVYRGKWVIDDVKPLFDKHNISVDYSIRGIYDPNQAVNPLPIRTTMPYVFRRIPLKYSLGFSIYAIWKRILRLIGKSTKYLNYAEYLASKEC